MAHAEETLPQTLPAPFVGTQLLHLQSQETLGTSELRAAVKRPNSIDEDTWIASKTREVFQETVRVVHFLSEICTEESCPRMCAGDKLEYKWADEVNVTPVSMTAPQYMQQLVNYVDAKLLDQEQLPTDGRPMPPTLRPLLQQLLRRLFRVYAHAYVHHFQIIREAGAEAHLNCNFKHFLFFVLEFKLVQMDEMLPLEGLIRKFAGDMLE
ncbi:unnamed protein product [Effrenium voratum]|uniref:Uncharacterized protein n=1 Tax=Effrenium voratum TaxID=2562239 RepID=A0AA36NED1_9DINO|nr:unnamed protein product [Effrenium voratum]